MKKVLIVGNGLELQERVLDVLPADEFRIFASSPGAAAIFQLYLAQPDLIILDGRTDVAGGVEALQHIRERTSTPAIVLLDQGDTSTRIKYLDRGADHCMSEPFDALELRARVRALLRRARQAARRQLEPALA